MAAIWVGPNRAMPNLHPFGGEVAKQAFDEVLVAQARVNMGESAAMVSIDLDSGLLSRDADGRLMPFLPNTAPEQAAPHHAPKKRAASKKKFGRH